MKLAVPLELFLKNVAERPDHIAVKQNDRQITYKELADLAARIAYRLQQISSCPKVMIHLPQSIEAYASIIACMSAGGFYCPTNTSAPTERQNLIMNLFKPDVIVSDVKFLPNTALKCEIIDIAKIGNRRLHKHKPAHDLAYVMFTSGSTGVPKGVIISQESLAHYVYWAIEQMSVKPSDRWSQHPNLGFDLSVLDIYGALCGGATLYPINRMHDKLQPSKFIKRHKLTIWNSVPSVVDQMLRSGHLKADELMSLRLITFCGEPLKKEHLDAVFRACQNIKVHNTYGPTEATVSVTLLTLNRDNYKEACGVRYVSIGKGIANMEVYLIKDDKKNQNEGEIVISGPQVARGYWEDPERTAANFKTLNINGKMTHVYCTGDYGSYKNGFLHFEYRLDRQVKVNGYRLELGEVDAAFQKAGIYLCWTILADGFLHTFIESSKNLDLAEIRVKIAKQLPSYAMPKEINVIEQLPRNVNGKINANELQALALATTPSP